jgi:hypothetical protein
MLLAVYPGNDRIYARPLIFASISVEYHRPVFRRNKRLSTRNYQEYSTACIQKCIMINELAGFRTWTENPRVGGSIPPLVTIQINISNQEVASERLESLSNISVGVQYFGPLFA